MRTEIQDSEKNSYIFSASDIRSLDLKHLQHEAFLTIRRQFLNQKDCFAQLEYYQELWIDRVKLVFTLPVTEDESDFLSLQIVSTLRDFFQFPRDIVVDINRGWIFLELKGPEQRDLWISCLYGAFLKSVEDEFQSWFLSIWEDIYSYSFLPPRKVDSISSLLIYQEWLKGRKSCRLTRVLFRWHLFLFLRKSGLGKRASAKIRVRRQKRRSLLSLRCYLQRNVKILLYFLAGGLSWRHNTLPVFMLSLIVSGLTVNYYSHSWNPSSPRREKPGLPGELIDPSRAEESAEISSAGAGFYHSLGEIERIRQYDYDSKKLQGIFWHEKEFDHRLVLTFDDGPNMALMKRGSTEIPVTIAVLDVLSTRGMRAVFFINGKNLETESPREEQELRNLFNRMIRDGHLIGNHSYHHYNLAHGIFNDGIRDYEEIKEELDTTQTALDRILGYHYPLLLIRPPYAEPGRTAVLDSILRDNRQYLISLQFDSYDYAYTKEGYWQPEKILSHVKALILPARGGVLLMHDRASSIPILESILDDPDIQSATEVVDLTELLFDRYGKKTIKKPSR